MPPARPRVGTGLENSNVSFEYVPLFTKFKAVNKMQRLAPNERP